MGNDGKSSWLQQDLSSLGGRRDLKLDCVFWVGISYHFVKLDLKIMFYMKTKFLLNSKAFHLAQLKVFF